LCLDDLQEYKLLINFIILESISQLWEADVASSCGWILATWWLHQHHTSVECKGVADVCNQDSNELDRGERVSNRTG